MPKKCVTVSRCNEQNKLFTSISLIKLHEISLILFVIKYLLLILIPKLSSNNILDELRPIENNPWFTYNFFLK